MIDLAPIAYQAGLPGIGCFLGTTLALWAYCPNKGCCRMKDVRQACEDGILTTDQAVHLERLIRSEK